MNATTATETVVTICQMDRCYACDKRAVGVAERWSNGSMEYVGACRRHSLPSVKKVIQVCRYCGTPVRKGSVNVGDGMYAHHRCHAEAERNG
jgi:hypothetical protein